MVSNVRPSMSVYQKITSNCLPVAAKLRALFVFGKLSMCGVFRFAPSSRDDVNALTLRQERGESVGVVKSAEFGLTLAELMRNHIRGWNHDH